MDIVASSSGRDVTDLENRLVSDLCTLQHDEERATENFAVSTTPPISAGLIQLTL
jgi:hypothetical protein